MSGFLHGMNCARKEAIEQGQTGFLQGQLERFEQRYDEIVALGREQNKHTKGKFAKKEERALLNRLEAYKANHLLFLHDFNILFSNNMSEKDLRICKNRQKRHGRKFCVSENRQSQKWRCGNRAESGELPLATIVPGVGRGMRAAGVNAGARSRES